MPFTIAVGAGIGLLAGGVKAKHDSAVTNYQNNVEATKERYSAFTGQHASPVEQANPWGDIISGAMTGAQGGAAFGNAMASKNYADAAAGWLNRGGNPGATGALQGAYGPAMAQAGSFWGVDMHPGVDTSPGGISELKPASNPWGMSNATYVPKTSMLGLTY